MDMKPIFVLTLLSVFSLARPQQDYYYLRRVPVPEGLNIDNDASNQVTNNQSRTLQPRLRVTPSTTITSINTTLITSIPTTAKPIAVKLRTKHFTTYVKPASSLVQIQKQYFENNGTRHNGTVEPTSTDNETSKNETRDDAISEISPTTKYIITNTTHRETSETTHKITQETTLKTTQEATQETETSLTLEGINKAIYKTLIQKEPHKSIVCYGKVNKKPTFKGQTYGYRNIHLRRLNDI